MRICDHILRPNYLSAPIQIFRATVQYCVATTNSLDVLSAAGQGDRDPEWPTWIPRWDLSSPAPGRQYQQPYLPLLQSSYSRILGVQLQQKPRFEASGDIGPSVRLRDSNALEVGAIDISYVAATGFPTAWNAGINHAQEFAWLEVMNDLIHFVSVDSVDVVAPELYKRCRDAWNWGTPDGSQSGSSTAIFRQFELSLNSPYSMQISASAWGCAARLIRTLVLHQGSEWPNTETERTPLNDAIIDLTTQDRALFVSTSGRIGLGPRSLRTGDCTYVILGCRVPIALRKQRTHSDSENVFTVVGECYVEGFMDGQAVRTTSDWQRKQKTIVLI